MTWRSCLTKLFKMHKMQFREQVLWKQYTPRRGIRFEVLARNSKNDRFHDRLMQPRHQQLRGISFEQNSVLFYSATEHCKIKIEVGIRIYSKHSRDLCGNESLIIRTHHRLWNRSFLPFRTRAPKLHFPRRYQRKDKVELGRLASQQTKKCLQMFCSLL